MVEKYPFTRDDGRFVPGKNFDPESFHPPYKGIGACKECRAVYVMSYSWEWMPYDDTMSLPGVWIEVGRKFTLVEGNKLPDLPRYYTTVACPGCGGEMDSGNFPDEI